jgi:ribosomal protein S18 acetylase RimI-like enzyme
MPGTDDILDNPAWFALTGRQSGLGRRLGGAARFDPELSPFVGLENGDQQSWDDLATLIGPGTSAVMFRPDRVPDDWTEAFAGAGLQMVAERVEPIQDDEIVRLGPADAIEMIALVDRTRPGPFEARTHEFGGYLGVRRDGALVAMAGQRLQPAGWTEISAVCTDESVRGQGLAGRLVRAVTGDIEARGDRALLHVAQSNTGAIRLYEKLGFAVRTEVGFAAFVSPS